MVSTPTYACVVSPDSVTYIEAHCCETFVPAEANKAKVMFARGTRAQLAHTHHVTDLTRFGEGICHSCGLTLWSPAWVAFDVFGAGTGEYMQERIRSWADEANHDHLRLSLPRILASMTDDDPASLSVTLVPTIGAPVNQPEPV